MWRCHVGCFPRFDSCFSGREVAREGSATPFPVVGRGWVSPGWSPACITEGDFPEGCFCGAMTVFLQDATGQGASTVGAGQSLAQTQCRLGPAQLDKPRSQAFVPCLCLTGVG